MLSTVSEWFLCGVLESGRDSAVIRIDREPFVIGRRPGLSLTLNSQFVSGKHAELNTLGERLFVTDLGSRNGTMVNGQRIRRVQLGVGDMLAIGDVEFRLDRQPRSNKRGKDNDLNAMNLRWMRSQFEQMLDHDLIAAVLRPVSNVAEGTVIAYRAMGQSGIAGLETEAKMIEAARLLGFEKEFNRLLLTAMGGAARQVAKGNWLFLQAPQAVNFEAEVLPVLNVLRQHLPSGRIVLEISDAPARSLRSITELVSVLQKLEMHLSLSSFSWEHVRFLQSSRVRPICVRLEASLTHNLGQQSEVDLQRLKSMVEQLHHYEIQVAASGIDDAADLEACKALDIDLVDGAHVGESLPLPSQVIPETCILGAGSAASIFAESEPEFELPAPGDTTLGVVQFESPTAHGSLEDYATPNDQPQETPQPAAAEAPPATEAPAAAEQPFAEPPFAIESDSSIAPLIDLSAQFQLLEAIAPRQKTPADAKLEPEEESEIDIDSLPDASVLNDSTIDIPLTMAINGFRMPR